MSIADFVRNPPKPTLPVKTITVELPGTDSHWLKRRFMESKRTERLDNEREDLIWIVPDLPGGEW